MSKEVKPSVAVVGPGAIGTTIAAALHEVGRTPLLCGRTAREDLTLHDGDNVITVPGPVHTDPSQIQGHVDVIFLAVKTTQNEAAAKWLAALVGPDTVVCALQNGVEQTESLSPYCPEGEVIPAVVWFPAQAQSDGSVQLRGEVRLSLPNTAAALKVSAQLQGTRCAVELADNFSSQAWRKLLQNAVAGLMVLATRRSGIFRRPDMAALSLAYLQECLTVARAEGAELGDEVPEQILERFQTIPTDMGTSILTDRLAGRPLEWEIRNGVIARRARAHGIPTPISDVLVPLLAAASDGPG